MKMYQAIDETVCIKEFGPELLPGWFATSNEALSAFRSEPQNEPEDEPKDEQPTGEQTQSGDEAKPRKAGRPKKAK